MHTEMSKVYLCLLLAGILMLSATSGCADRSETLQEGDAGEETDESGEGWGGY
jgi:hypothetical protein